jgi:hypothetical protein
MQRQYRNYILILMAAAVAVLAGCSSHSEDADGAVTTGSEQIESVTPEAASQALQESAGGPPAQDQSAVEEAAGEVKAIEQRSPLDVAESVPSTPEQATASPEKKRSPSSPPASGQGWFANTPPGYPMGDERARKVRDAHKNDPEFESVITGRRVVDEHDLVFDGGASSPSELAQWITETVCSGDKDGLRDLMIAQEEFSEILWPEFPQSRPALTWTAAEVWGVHLAKAHEGAAEGINLYEGDDLAFDYVTCDEGVAPYTNFTLYHGIHIHTHRPDGREVVMEFAKAFAERRGKWKVYIYKD